MYIYVHIYTNITWACHPRTAWTLLMQRTRSLGFSACLFVSYSGCLSQLIAFVVRITCNGACWNTILRTHALFKFSFPSNQHS